MNKTLLIFAFFACTTLVYGSENINLVPTEKILAAITGIINHREHGCIVSQYHPTAQSMVIQNATSLPEKSWSTLKTNYSNSHGNLQPLSIFDGCDKRPALEDITPILANLLVHNADNSFALKPRYLAQLTAISDIVHCLVSGKIVSIPGNFKNPIFVSVVTNYEVKEIE